MSNSIVNSNRYKPRPNCKIKDCDKPADISLLKEFFCASHGTLQLRGKEKSNGK